MTKPEALFSKLSLRAAALAVLGLALSACDTPTSPQETAERVANALMKGSEEELSPCSTPRAKQPSFRPARSASIIRALPSARLTTLRRTPNRQLPKA